MPNPTGDRPLSDIDLDLRSSLANQESARREIRRLMAIVVSETTRVDQLLAERSRRSHHEAAQAIADDISRLKATP